MIQMGPVKLIRTADRWTFLVKELGVKIPK